MNSALKAPHFGHTSYYSTMHTGVPAIPVIDVSESEDLVVAAIRDACRGKGFMQIINHPIPDDKLDGIMALARKFFDLPIEEKVAAAMTGSKSIRGYTEMSGQALEPGTAPDLKEGFYYGQHITKETHPHLAGRWGHGPNILPREDVIPGFDATMHEYYEMLLAFCKTFMSWIALSLDLDRHYFDAFSTDPIATLRMVHYPPTPLKTDASFRGAGAHSDYGGITLLMQDDVGGLQVWDRDCATFVDVPSIPHAFVVNLGDMVERWSNDHYHSTVHRVINKSNNRSRYSIPFFMIGNGDQKVDCLPGLEGAGKKYVACTVEENYRQKHEDAYNRAGVKLK